jgi:hypothetical protein
MKVRAVKDFETILNGIKVKINKDAEFDLPKFPKGAEWLSAGLVIPVRERKVETAVKKPQERAVTR